MPPICRGARLARTAGIFARRSPGTLSSKKALRLAVRRKAASKSCIVGKSVHSGCIRGTSCPLTVCFNMSWTVIATPSSCSAKWALHLSATASKDRIGSPCSSHTIGRGKMPVGFFLLWIPICLSLLANWSGGSPTASSAKAVNASIRSERSLFDKIFANPAILFFAVR